MKLLTQIPFHKQENNLLINYNSSILLLGSCFAEHIGEKLEYYKLKNLSNPFGILFHPLAIKNLVFNAINKKEFSKAHIFLQNEQWHCFDAHSRLDSTSKELLIETLNQQNKLVLDQLETSTHLIITLGTAWVYRFLKTNEVVANCHKVAQKEFSKELLSVTEIIEILSEIYSMVKGINPICKIIFTISPVRHLKDGFIENTRSKAHLIAAVHQFINLQSEIGSQQLFYFPSYEIIMDELRDYRFYNEDLLHPNPIAVNYIWQKFQETWFSEEAISFSKRIEAVQKSLNHKPFNAESKAHKIFLENLDQEKTQIKAFFPHISF